MDEEKSLMAWTPPVGRIDWGDISISRFYSPIGPLLAKSGGVWKGSVFETRI